MLGFRCKLAVLPHKEIVQRGLFVFFFFCSLQWGTLATKTRQTLGGTRNVAREEEAMRSFPGTYFGNDTIKHCIW